MISSKQKRILLIPSISRGNGTGHIRRSFLLAADFLKLGIKSAVLAAVSAPFDGETLSLDEIGRLMPQDGSIELITEAVGADWDICIFDMRQSPSALLKQFSGSSFCIGIDEGGALRASFDYLIDTLPNLETAAPNIASTAFLNLPEAAIGKTAPDEASRRLKSLKAQNGRLLISFGGEDKPGLTTALTRRILDENLFGSCEITVVIGALFDDIQLPDRFRILDAPEELSSMLSAYDLVITSFGLTCFEALHSEVPVILFNPSEYHRKLSIKAGIPEIGVCKPDVEKLKKLINRHESLETAVENYSGVKKRELAAFITGLSIPPVSCFGCGTTRSEIIFRNEVHSFFKCSSCGLVNGMYFGEKQMSYGSEYFFDDYKKQYGKTYLEDFEKIKMMGLRRCRNIRRYRKDGRLLDVGCGYGPFLSAAADSGYQVAGIDISENAAGWVCANLGFKAAASAVEDFSPLDVGVESFDAVTMWFVIEHLRSLPAVLDKIHSMLEPGGVFAFSTPNYNGISRRRSAEGFLKSNPLDHYTIWSPSSARRLLSRHGFKLKRVKCPVIHPDRFFNAGFYDRLPSALRRIIGFSTDAAGRLLNFGDTFEVYAVKIKDSGRSA